MLTNACGAPASARQSPVMAIRPRRSSRCSDGGQCESPAMSTERSKLVPGRFGLFVMVLMLVLGQCHDIEALKITKLTMPSPIANGTQPAIIIDCDYKYEQQDKRGLVIKWFFNNSISPIYQWIPPHKPEALGLFKERLDLEHKTAADPYTIHRSLRIMRPTLEMSGIYRCQVSSFQSEDEAEGELIVYAPATVAEINYTKPTPRNVNVTCTAAGVFPVPEAYLLVYRDGSETPEIIKDVRLVVVYHEDDDEEDEEGEESGNHQDTAENGNDDEPGRGNERAVGGDDSTRNHGNRGRKVAAAGEGNGKNHNDDGNSVLSVAKAVSEVNGNGNAASLVGSYEATLYGLIEDRWLASETQFECLFKIEKAGYEKRTDRMPYFPDLQGADDNGASSTSSTLCGLTAVVCLTVSRFLVRL